MNTNLNRAFFTVGDNKISKYEPIVDTSICAGCPVNGTLCKDQKFDYTDLAKTNLASFPSTELPCGLTLSLIIMFAGFKPKPGKEVLVLNQVGKAIKEI